MLGRRTRGALVGGCLALLLTIGCDWNTKAEPLERTEKYGIAHVETKLLIREGPGREYPVVGQMENTALCQITEEREGWARMTSGSISGYASLSYLYTGELAAEMVEQVGEENFPLADVYTEEALPAAASVTVGSEVAEYALGFVGNPYVWGGTSLTEGADCSGFVQSVYAQYGIALPRVAQEQAESGPQVEIGRLIPGDLVFYYDGESIYHVALYIGDGQVVHASSPADGIKVSDLYYEQAIWGVRLL